MVADQVRAALESADLTAFAHLLDPNVTWGAPGDPSPTCQNRTQVLDWYRVGQAEGRRARVLDVTCHGDKILVTSRVTAVDSGEVDRWQVLTVAAGRVVDIRGYDRQEDAKAAAGIATLAP
jgi:hypothetical protein